MPADDTFTREEAAAFYATAQAEYRGGGSAWTAAPEGMWLSSLEAVPPAEQTRGAFLVGEPYDHNPEGTAVYLAFRRVAAGRWEGRYLTRSAFRAMFGPSYWESVPGPAATS